MERVVRRRVEAKGRLCRRRVSGRERLVRSAISCEPMRADGGSSYGLGVVSRVGRTLDGVLLDEGALVCGARGVSTACHPVASRRVYAARL